VNKRDLAKELAATYGIPIHQSVKILNGTFERIVEIITDGEEYNHSGFGKFRLADVKGRSIHDISTGDIIDIPERKQVKFSPSRQLGRELNLDS